MILYIVRLPARRINRMGAMRNMKHTAIYVRQSADRADSVSLETQEQLCRRDVPPDTSVQVYSDRGFSGRNTDRPALRALLAAVRADAVSRVLVYKLNRISRNLADFTQLLREFEQHRVMFESHTERFETASPMGQAMQSLLMVFAQLERETISGRVRDAAFARARAGFDTGGRPPFGFCKVPHSIGGKRTQKLAPDARAQAAADAFSQYLHAEGSLTAVCGTWNRKGIRTACGGAWSPNTLCRLLRNPVYAQADFRVYAYLSSLGAELCIPDPLPEHRGVYLYTDRRLNQSRFTDLHGCLAICAPHTGLVPPELWLGCQKKLDASRKIRNTGKGRSSFLSGVIFCMHCGSAMTTVQGRHALYLICGGRKRGKCSGAGAVWTLAAAEQLVGAVIAARLDALRQTAVLPDTQAGLLRQELAALYLRREQLVQRLTDAPADAFDALTEAASRLGTQCRKTEQLLAEQMRPQCTALPDWNTSDLSARRTIARTLLEAVFADGETLHALLR